MANKKGLGRGMLALLAEDPEPARAEDHLPIAKVEPRGGQPRTSFDEESLQELADSIAQHGLLQPVTVRPLSDGYYQIVAGERRWRAARLAGLSEIPVRVIDADDRTTQELALVENLQREDLNPMEEARGYQALMEEFGLTQEEVSRSVGKSRPAVANALRLLKLCPEVAEMLENGLLSSGHARALLPIENAEDQLEAAQRIINGGLSVRQTEALVSSLLKRPKQIKPEKEKTIDYAEIMSTQLGEALGRKVSIIDGRKRGRIELEYYGADDREALLQALMTLKK